MANFADELKRTSQNNTPEKRNDREREKYLNELYSYIKNECMDTAKRGILTSCQFRILDSLDKLVDEDSYEYEDFEKLFFKGPGEGYPAPKDRNMKIGQRVLVDAEGIKNFLEIKLSSDGLHYRFKAKEIVKYEVVVKVTENSTSTKLFNGAMNALFDSNYDVDTTTKRKRREVGKQIKDYTLTVSWGDE